MSYLVTWGARELWPARGRAATRLLSVRIHHYMAYSKWFAPTLSFAVRLRRGRRERGISPNLCRSDPVNDLEINTDFRLARYRFSLK